MLLFIILTVLTRQVIAESPCDSLIYCQGEFYQRMMDVNPHIYKAMLYPERTILQNSSKLLLSKNKSLTPDDLNRFSDEHFREEENDVLMTQDFLMKYPAEKIRKGILPDWDAYATKGVFNRKFSSDQYSLLSPYEFYNTKSRTQAECSYWDNYLIVNSLLASKSYITAQRVIDNLVSMVKRFGMVPGANRVFYATRSNPPLLTPMVYNFYRATRRKSWLNRTIGILERELLYWMENRAVNVTNGKHNYTLYHYNSNCTEPRPEMYKLDTAFGEIIPDKNAFYRELNTLTETGWGMSKRWVFTNNYAAENGSELLLIQPSRVIPVDLNAILFKAFKYISTLYNILENQEKQWHWWIEAKKLIKAINAVLWNMDDMTWYDYDLQLNQPRNMFFMSNLVPIWANAYSKATKDKVLNKAFALLVANYPDFTLQEQIPESRIDLGYSLGNPTLVPHLHALLLEGFYKSKFLRANKYFGEMLAEMLDGKIYEWMGDGKNRKLPPVIGSYINILEYYVSDKEKALGEERSSISSRLSYMLFVHVTIITTYYFVVNLMMI